MASCGDKTVVSRFPATARSTASPISAARRSVSDYNDPELFEFACAALRSAGVDPQSDVGFVPLPGTPLDAERMAAAVRDNEVQAVWQLDVFAGFMAAEGVPLRLLPAPALDRLTPSSCLIALDANLAGTTRGPCGAWPQPRQGNAVHLDQSGSGGPVDVGTLSGCGTRSLPRSASSAFKRELAALEVRTANQRIDQAPGAQWGAITEAEMAAWQDFLLETQAIATRRAPSTYYSDEFVATYNDFDPAPVIAAARNFKPTLP